MITEIFDLFCFVGRAVYWLLNLMQVIDALVALARGLKWCVHKFVMPFGHQHLKERSMPAGDF